jgi:hypothetical protein
MVLLLRRLHRERTASVLDVAEGQCRRGGTGVLSFPCRRGGRLGGLVGAPARRAGWTLLDHAHSLPRPGGAAARAFPALTSRAALPRPPGVGPAECKVGQSGRGLGPLGAGVGRCRRSRVPLGRKAGGSRVPAGREGVWGGGQGRAKRSSLANVGASLRDAGRGSEMAKGQRRTGRNQEGERGGAEGAE